MSQTTELPRTGEVVYSLEGTMLEAYACSAIHPCWIDNGPHGPERFGFVAYRIHKGEIDGIDVAGLKLATVVHIPGGVMDGGRRCVAFIDKRAGRVEKDAIAHAFTGRLGGPLADRDTLMREAAGPYSVPMCYDIIDGAGMLRVGTVLEADFEPYRGPDAAIPVFGQAVPPMDASSPARLAKVTNHKVTVLEHGMVWSFASHSGIQSHWTAVHAV